MALSQDDKKMHFRMAMSAVKNMGVPKRKAKKVLKNLLELYDNQWELIEEDGYRVLFDAIFEYPDSEEEEHGNRLQRNNARPEPVRLRSHARTDHQSCTPVLHPNNVDNATSKRPRLEESVSPQTYIRTPALHPCSVEGETSKRRRSEEPVSPQTHLQESQIVLETDPKPIYFKTPKSEPHTEVDLLVALHEPKKDDRIQMNSGFHNSDCPGSSNVDKLKARVGYPLNALREPKQENMFDYPQLEFERPIAVIHPPNCSKENSTRLSVERGHPILPGNDYSHSKEALESLASEYSDVHEEVDGVQDATCKNDRSLELVSIPEASSSAVNYELASTSAGEVKLSLSYNSTNGWTDLDDDFLKLVEDRCLKSYKYLGPSFSVVKLMKDFCQSFLELSADATDKQQRHINVASNLNFVRPNVQDILGVRTSGVNGPLEPTLYTDEIVPQIPKLLVLNGPDGPRNGIESKSHGNLTCESSKKKKNFESTQMLNSLVPFDDFRPLHDVNDISKGEEKIRISVVNEVSSEQYPPYFHYIPENTVYQNAYLNFSLARGGDEDCCSCFADCLSSSVPCICARETGGEFAYTLDGLIKNEFLDEAISMNLEPHNHKLVCKGHLVRKFIKECWRKCGCHKQCGNRVVQRGITHNLQVFFSSEGKGWGLRTLEELPRGAFVCEYVGEVLTNTELHNRNRQKSGNEKHTYSVLLDALDADWGSEGALKDEEALCLDATYYGNVARFINHRCSDANLVEIPVEVEVPDHHYYHIAFFTTRNVEALEELTWDYGIDFNDHELPMKAFKCLCGSKLCRGVKHTNRAKPGVLSLNGKHHL